MMGRSSRATAATWQRTPAPASHRSGTCPANRRLSPALRISKGPARFGGGPFSTSRRSRRGAHDQPREPIAAMVDRHRRPARLLPRAVPDSDCSRLQPRRDSGHRWLRRWRPRALDDRYRSPVADMKGHSAGITSVSFSRDGRSILSSGLDGKACVWPVPDREARKLQLQHARLGPSLAAHQRSPPRGSSGTNDGRPLPRLGGSADRYGHRRLQPQAMAARKRDGVAGVRLPARPHERIPSAREGRRSDQAVRANDSEDDAPIGALAVAVSPRGSVVYVACGGSDSNVDLVRSADPFTGKPDSKPFLGHTDPILDVAVSPDGQQMATASATTPPASGRSGPLQGRRAAGALRRCLLGGIQP